MWHAAKHSEATRASDSGFGFTVTNRHLLGKFSFVTVFAVVVTAMISAPAGTPVGAPGLGALPYFSFDTTELSVDTIVRVNLGNGNLLLTSNDGVLNGPGFGLRNDRFYNGCLPGTGPSAGAGCPRSSRTISGF